MADYKTQLYNVALGTQGFLLNNTPSSPARTMLQAPTYNNRFASGDRSYEDFTFWWFWAQTDWSGGIKNERIWKDDAMFTESLNLDCFSKTGEIGLRLKPALNANLETAGIGGYPTARITCSEVFTSEGYNCIAVGTRGDSAGDQTVFIRTSLTTASYFNYTDGQQINDLEFFKANLYVACNTGTDQVKRWNKSGSADIAKLTASVEQNKPKGLSSDENYILITHKDDSTVLEEIYSSSTGDSEDWLKRVTLSAGEEVNHIVSNKNIFYYLVESGKETILKTIDPSDWSVVEVWRWNKQMGTTPCKSQMEVYNNKIWIKLGSTGETTEIWSVTTSNVLKREFSDENDYIEKNSPFNLIDGRLWLGNFVIEQVAGGDTYFFHGFQNIGQDDYLYPLGDYFGNLYSMDSTGTDGKIYADSSSYYSTGYLQTSQFEIISSVTKLWYSATVFFDAFEAGEGIKTEYSIDNGVTWTEIGGTGNGTASYALDGSTIVEKTIYFSENVVSKKIALKFTLTGDGTSSPTITDFVVDYYPLPNYKQRWALSLSCIDDLKLLDGKTKETKRGEELRSILKTYWKDKNVLAFQDIDFAETLINEAGGLSAINTTVTVDSTASFPEQGVITIDKEKIKYTGRTALTFTDCTRGYEDSMATSHADNATCSNEYKVIITNYSESVPVGAEAKINEFIVTLELMET